MVKKRVLKPFQPCVSIEEMLAYDKNRPETYTCSPLVNAVCEAFGNHEMLGDGEICEYLSLDPDKLTNAMEIITGHKMQEIRADFIKHEMDRYVAEHPDCRKDELALHLGFNDYSGLWRFKQRWKEKFPQRDGVTREMQRAFNKLVKTTMAKEDEWIMKTYQKLPYEGTYEEQVACFKLLYRHSRAVADLALDIAKWHPEMGLDLNFIEEAALLHDIGIVETDAPGIHCFGGAPYLQHGELGAQILSRKGCVKHALVAMRHTGAGITREEIIAQKLPLTVGHYLPESLEEKLICYADKFFSKSHPERRKTMEEARRSLEKFGGGTMERFEEMVRMFGEV